MSNENYDRTGKDSDKVKYLTVLGLTQEQIAETLNVSIPTLTKHYSRELKHAKADCNAKVFQSLYYLATVKKNVAAIIFYLKTVCGLRETDRLEVTGKDGSVFNPQITINLKQSNKIDDAVNITPRVEILDHQNTNTGEVDTNKNKDNK